MKNTTRLMDIIQRCLTGPIVDEQQFDSEHVTLGLRRVVKQYDIHLDRSHVVNLDDGLADRVWEAALDFLVNCGIYCLDTGRVIQFTHQEIDRILSEAPEEVLLGSGEDAVRERSRPLGESRPPSTWAVP